MFPGVEQLRDIHGIQGVPWWPPGPGWWLLTAVVLALAFLIWRFRAKLRVTLPPVPFFTVGSWHWDAARRLRDLRQRAGTQDNKQTAGELSELLRRIAMARLGRDACAGLTGQDWLAWLQDNDPKGFDWSRQGQALLEVPYAPPADSKRSQALLVLIDAAYDWVEVEERKKRRGENRMFEFHWPWVGLLLPLPLLLPFLWPDRRRGRDEELEGQRTTLLHPHLQELRSAFQARRPRRRLAGWFHKALLYLLWAGLVLALMRPQWLEPHTQVSTPGYDLMLAVDASHSMDALDFTVEGRQVSRMQVVKGVMGRFVDARKGDRIGLIVFGSQAFVLSPLSVDRLAVRQLLDGVVPSIAGQGTALGDAIALSVKKLRERPEGSRVMILIADGDNSAGGFAPLESAVLARAAGVRIYVIGVGSKQESIPILEEGVIKYRDDLTMDEDTLQRIANIGGGAYFRATDTRALEEISTRIGQLEKTEAESRTAFLPTPLYRIPLAVALLALLGLGLFPEGRKRFVTRVASA